MIRRRFFLSALVIVLALAFVPVFSVSGIDNYSLNSDKYYKAVAQLVSSRWEDSYFSRAILSVGDDTLVIDHNLFKLEQNIAVVGGEVMLPHEALTKLGLVVAIERDRVLVTKQSRQSVAVEFALGEKTIWVNGLKKDVPFAAVLSDGQLSIPASILREHGFDVAYDECTGEIYITCEFQMARLNLKMERGKSLPSSVKTEKTLAGPDGLYVLQFSTVSAAKDAYSYLRELPYVVFVEPDKLVTSMAATLEYALLEQTSQTYTHLGWGAGRIGSDKYLDYLIAKNKQNASVVVAVIDTGLDSSHSYFSGRYVDGYNFFSNNTNTFDNNGHGTHVSGTIIDITIALPNVVIMPVKVLNAYGQGTTIIVSNGIRWAADQGVDVMNLSLGGLVFPADQGVDDSVRYAFDLNTTVIVAAGNEKADAVTVSPARSSHAITVSAFDYDGTPAPFTNFGACVDIAAPGIDIRSTIPGNRTMSLSGTSMASPHVAAAAALLLCNDASLTPSLIKTILCQSAEGFTFSDGKHYGVGFLSVENAINFASEFIFATPNNLTEYVKAGPIQRQLNVELYREGIITNITAQAVYSSSDINVATVSSAGLVTVFGVGKAQISVRYAEKNIVIPVTGLNIEPLMVKRSVPVHGETSAVLTDRISVVFNHRLVAQVRAWSLTDASGKAVEWLTHQTVLSLGETEFTLVLPKVLAPNTEYVFSILAGDVVCDYGSLADDYVLRFTTGSAYVSATSIKLEAFSNSMYVNQSMTVYATVSPTETSDKKLSWQSSNPSIARIVTTDLFSMTADIRGVAIGTATIIASTADGMSASFIVYVRDQAIAPTGVVIEPSEITMRLRETQQIVATVFPLTANHSLSWTSSNRDVVSVISNGILYAHNPGSAIITATTVNGFTATCLVNVYPESISFTKTSAQLFIGDVLQLEVIGVPAGYPLSWRSENEAVVSVSSTGVIIARSAGATVVTATTPNGLIASCSISVVRAPVSVEISQNTVSLAASAELSLFASVLPMDAVSSIVWSSSDENVATVSATGTITAKNPGTATITATTVNGLKAFCMVTVSVAPEGVTLSHTAINLFMRNVMQLVATVVPYNADDKAIVWSSSNQEVVSVSQYGIVTPHKIGVATITATTTNGIRVTCEVTVIDTYTIWFDANGGHGAPASQTKISGSELLISMEQPIREGYSFLGWTTNVSSLIPELQPGEPYAGNSDLRLFALWQPVAQNASGMPTWTYLVMVAVGILCVFVCAALIWRKRRRVLV